MAVEVPLAAFKRVPYVNDIVYVGPDWHAATFLLHVRPRYGDTATPTISLANAAAGSQGISATYLPAYVYPHPKTGEDITAPATKILLQIDEATLEALSLGTPVDAPVELVYDLHATPTGDIKRVVTYGSFTIYPGSTI